MKYNTSCRVGAKRIQVALLRWINIAIERCPRGRYKHIWFGISYDLVDFSPFRFSPSPLLHFLGLVPGSHDVGMGKGSVDSLPHYFPTDHRVDLPHRSR